jgi:hypothetical protein
MTSSQKFSSLLVTIAVLGLSTVGNAALTHRFSFSEAAVKDSVGKVEGTLYGGAKVADGKLVLENGDKTSDNPELAYLELKTSVLPKSGSVSIVFWINAKENGAFARVVNFGETTDGSGSAFIYITPRTQDGQARAAISATDTASKTALDFNPVDDGKPHCVAVVIDGTAKKLRVYVDGKEAGTAQDLGDNTLDKVKPTSNWIGRSSFTNDSGLTGALDELRIYDHALTAAEAEAINKAGVDILPPSPAAPAATPAAR